MANKHFEQKIAKTIEKLSNPVSYENVCHDHQPGELLPSLANLGKIIQLIREILFPGYFGNTSLHSNMARHYMGVYVDELFELLNQEILAGLCFDSSLRSPDKRAKLKNESTSKTLAFIEHLPEIRRKLVTDVQATFLNDPAARNYGEVIFCYPAIRTLTNYRVANQLLQLEIPLIPRIISEMAHSETGIDIHPKAQIGESITIDHGTGVVIGSTAILGNNIKIYQGVTLGAKSFPVDENGNPIKGIPRHPVIEDDVVIYAGATILGRVTIGRGSVIGGNVWITRDVPPNSRIIQTSAKQESFSNGAGI